MAFFPKCIASEKNVSSVKCQSKATHMELIEEMCLFSRCQNETIQSEEQRPCEPSDIWD